MSDMNTLSPYLPYLKYVEEQHERMISLVQQWAHINSGSYNEPGIARMRQALASAFGPYGDSISEIALQPRRTLDSGGNLQQSATPNGLSIRKRAGALIQVFLNGHMDTVYGPDSPFQTCRFLENNRLNGPGVADLKGGLVILLIALEAFEKSPFAANVGWEVFFNPDEEIGSVGSTPYLQKQAPQYDVGFIVEPQFADGAFVHERKGSANFSLVSRGRSAHAGRHFHQGVNAIAALLDPLQKLHAINTPGAQTTLNIGMLHGGTAQNIVPDLAIAGLDLRAASEQDMEAVREQIIDIVEQANTNGAQLELHQFTHRTPKPFDATTKALFAQAEKSAGLLGLPMPLRQSGGVCDGNTLAAMGLPVIDSLGATGGHIHTIDEYIELDKLIPRAHHIALMLMQIGSGEFALPTKD